MLVQGGGGLVNAIYLIRESFSKTLAGLGDQTLLE